MFAAMHREGTGGSGIDIQVQAPGMAALESIKPSAASQARHVVGPGVRRQVAAAELCRDGFRGDLEFHAADRLPKPTLR